MERYNVLFLVIATIFCGSPSLAQERNCRSAFVYFGPNSCQIPGRPPYFVSGEECGVAYYNACIVKHVTVTSKEVSYRVRNYGPGSPNDKCSAVVETPEKSHELAKSVQDAFNSDPVSFKKTFNIADWISDITPYLLSAEKATLNLHMVIHPGGNRKFATIDCTASVTYDFSYSDSDPSCSVNSYKSCRGPFYEKSVRKECGENFSRAAIFETITEQQETDLGRHGWINCLTEDSLPERDEEEVAYKAHAINANISALEGSVGIISEPIAPLNLVPVTDSNAVARTISEGLVELSRLAPDNLGLINDRDEPIGCGSGHELFLCEFQQLWFHKIDDAFSDLADHGRVTTIIGLRKLFPAEFDAFYSKQRDSFLSLNSDAFASLFANGVSLTDSEFNSGRLQIKTLTGAAAYRFAEAYVRSGLSKIRGARARAIELMDLRTRLRREILGEDALVAEMLRISPEGSDVSRELSQYASDNDKLRAAAEAIIDTRYRTLSESTIPRLEGSIRNMVDLAQNRPNADVRLPLLSGFMSLYDFNVDGFNVAYTQVQNVLRSSTAITENTNSMQLLIESAGGTLEALDDVKRILDNSEEQGAAAASAISMLARLASVQQRAELDPNVLSVIHRAAAQFDGGPGSDFALREGIREELSSVDDEFVTALRKIPELDN